MKRLIWLLLLMSASGLFGQTFSVAHHPAEGYELKQKGYPSRLVAGPDDRLYYVEYLAETPERRYEGHYLRCMRADAVQAKPSDQNILWSALINLPGRPAMRFHALLRMERSLAVVGHQWDEKLRNRRLVVQFYTFEGKEIGPLQVISTYLDHVPDEFSDSFVFSPSTAKVLWMGVNTEESPDKRRYFCSVWRTSGRLHWGHEVILPHIQEGYAVQDAQVDENGRPCFLMAHDTRPPLLIFYDPERHLCTERIVQFGPKLYVADARLMTTPQNETLVTAMLTDVSDTVCIRNQWPGYAALWNRLGLQRYTTGPEPEVTAQAAWVLPDTLLRRYAEGAFFSRHRLLNGDDLCYWLLEESRSEPAGWRSRHVRRDLAVFAFDPQTLNLTWTTLVDKNQRGTDAPDLLDYYPVLRKNYLHLTYLDGWGAESRLMLATLDRRWGGVRKEVLQYNDSGEFFFFADRSCFTQSERLVLLGKGAPRRNEYYLLTIHSLP